MANQIIPMSKLRKFLKLSLEGKSLRQISELTGMSRNTIFKYNDLLKKHPLSQKELANLSDKELYSIVYPPAVEKQAHEVLYGLFPEMDVKLSRVGVTKFMLWEQYKQNHPEGLQYSRFCEHYKRYEKSQQITCVLEHKAGDKMMVDFAGKKLSLIDKETGEAIPVEFFVAILPCSQYTYAEACLSQQTPDFLHCLGNALSWFGGVPEAIVTDNLKPSVNKASRYDPEINHSMSDFADHYDTVVLPTRVKKPKDKALVESAVNILYTRIYAPLHDRVFHTLQELNDAVTELLCKHNQQYFQGKTISRKQQFDTLERNVLKPLPTCAFEQKTYLQAKVHPNCHVMLGKDKHHYSVPYQYIGKKVEIGYTSQTVEVYLKYERIAIHQRTRTPYRYTTNEAHLHPRHQFYQNWSQDHFIKQGMKIGPNTLRLVEQMFLQCKHPEQAFKGCQGVLQLASKHGNHRIEEAASVCIQYDFVSYSKLDRILTLTEKGLLASSNDDNQNVNIDHKNIRGESYYK